MKKYILILLIVFNLKLYNTEIKLKYTKTYPIKIKSTFNTCVYKIKKNSFLIDDSEKNVLLLINNIKDDNENIDNLINIKKGRILYLENELVSIQYEEFIPYTFSIEDKNFEKKYTGQFNFKDNALYYKNDYISEIFQVWDLENDNIELISADNADTVKLIEDKILYIKNFTHEGLKDLWVYDINSKEKMIISDNTEGYIILNEDLILICRNSDKASYGHIYPEYYLIDSKGYIKGKFENEDFNSLYFTSGEIVNNKYLILSGSNENEKGIFLYEYKIKEEKNAVLKEKIVDNILFRTSVDNLRLRSEPSLDSKIFYTLAKGEWVRILRKGESITINGVTGNWVKVFTKYCAGWAFDAYLEEVKKK